MLTRTRDALARLAAAKDGERHYDVLRELRETQYLDRDALHNHQLRKLRRLLRHAFDNVPYYRDQMIRLGIDPGGLDRLEDLGAMPVLTKADIQKNEEELVAANFCRDALIADCTGGSTGKPLRFYHDPNRMDSRRAVEIRHNEWAGWSVGRRIAVVWGAPQDLTPRLSFKGRMRRLLIEPRRILDSSSLTEQSMSRFAEELVRFKPWGILGYAGSLFEFAVFVRKSKKYDIRPHSIITSAEVLDPEARSFIEETFHARVFNRYGCREVTVVASECSQHDGMHIAADCLIVEVLQDDGTPAPPGHQGQIVVTDLNNLGMPLIRYAIEDVGALSGRQCACGRALPLLDKVAGRTTDFIVRPDGMRVAGPAIGQYVMVNVPGIRQAQIVQRQPDAIIIRLVKDMDYSEASLLEIEQQMPRFLGDMTITYEFVQDIPRSASGKYRFTINEMIHRQLPRSGAPSE